MPIKAQNEHIFWCICYNNFTNEHAKERFVRTLLLQKNDKKILMTVTEKLCLPEPMYVVGGYVRNALLGLPPSDLDVASANLPEAVIRNARATGIKAKLVNERLGTVELEVGEQRIEHTSFRKESYGPGGGHTPIDVQIGVTLEEDAFRRDFSMNALYYDFMQDTLLDPTNRGLEDIKKRRLRSTTPDPSHIIKDDALRLLRMVRLAAQMNLTIEKDLFATAKCYVHQIHDIPKERIIKELDQILMADEAYRGTYKQKDTKKALAIQKGLLYLDSLGLLELLIPEFAGFHSFGKSKYHKHNIWLHTIYTVAYTKPDIILRYGALFHDVGKPGRYLETGKMLGHDILGAQIVEHRLPTLGADKKTTRLVAELVLHHMYDLNGKAKENKLRIKAQQLGYTQFYRLADLREADVWGSGIEEGPVYTAEKFRMVAKKMQAENTPMSIRELAVDGNDLQVFLGIKGQLVGQTLGAMLKHCALLPKQNTKERLLHFGAGYIKNK